jgi:CRISPR-associated protein Cas1
MIKRIIEISDGPTYLSIELDQLVLTRERAEIGRVPCEDVGILIVDNSATVYTHSVFTRLLERGAAVLLCDGRHLPAGMMLSYEPNSLLGPRMAAQAGAALPLRKRLWRQIVRSKVRLQAANLAEDDPAKALLVELSGRVKSGDPENIEAQAAVEYWPALLGPAFRRDPEGEEPNGMLNYGYAVMRAAVARALCGAGLHPAMGLHHHGRANPFSLADDLMEVLRPRVDLVVLELVMRKRLMVDREGKAALLGILLQEARVGGMAGPLMVGLHRVAASLVRCYEGVQEELDLPEE